MKNLHRRNAFLPGRRHGGLRRAVAIVEFALIVPVLLALIVGIMEFGWLVKNNLTLANAAREGARVASVGKTTTDVFTRIQNSTQPLSLSSPDGGVDMRWSDNNGTDNYPYTISDSGTQNSVVSGKLIKITVRSKFKPLTGFFPFLQNRTMVAYATMRRE